MSRKYRNYYNTEGLLMKAAQVTTGDICYYDKELTILMSPVIAHERVLNDTKTWIKAYLKIPSSQRQKAGGYLSRMGVSVEHDMACKNLATSKEIVIDDTKLIAHSSDVFVKIEGHTIDVVFYDETGAVMLLILVANTSSKTSKQIAELSTLKYNIYEYNIKDSEGSRFVCEKYQGEEIEEELGAVNLVSEENRERIERGRECIQEDGEKQTEEYYSYKREIEKLNEGMSRTRRSAEDRWEEENRDVIESVKKLKRHLSTLRRGEGIYKARERSEKLKGGIAHTKHQIRIFESRIQKLKRGDATESFPEAQSIIERHKEAECRYNETKEQYQAYLRKAQSR